MDYFLPTAVETPHWETDHTVTPSPHHPIGAKGVAESPHVGGIPCFSNAVVDAFAHLGVTHMDMPHTACRVWQQCRRSARQALTSDRHEGRIEKSFRCPARRTCRGSSCRTSRRSPAACPARGSPSARSRALQGHGDGQARPGDACRFAARSRSGRSTGGATLRLARQGTDSTGSSGASMDIGARIECGGNGLSTLVGTSVVSMSGKAAAFGGRMMTSVADQISSSSPTTSPRRSARSRRSARPSPGPDSPGPVAAAAVAALPLAGAAGASASRR
jgi:hypothetical protein